MDNRPSRVGTILLWGAVALIVTGMVCLVLVQPQKSSLPPPAEKPVVTRALTLSARSVTDLVVLTGRIEPLREATLAVEQEGVIAERAVDKGDRVTAGQLLLRSDPRLWQTAVAQAAIAQTDAERDLRRWQELRRTGAVSDSDYDAVTSRYASAEVVLDEARVRLLQCDVRAPFGGVIDARWVERGEFAARGREAFRLVDVAQVKLRFAVPERDVRYVRTGVPVEFTVAADPSATHTGRVTFIATVASQQSNTFDVELTADNPGGRLRPGMLADVRLVRRVIETGTVVPLAAVVPRKGEHVVYVEQDGRAVRRVVQMVVIMGDEAVLSSGVAIGDRVIVEGQRTLQDGSLLELQAEPGTPEPADGRKD